MSISKPLILIISAGLPWLVSADELDLIPDNLLAVQDANFDDERISSDPWSYLLRSQVQYSKPRSVAQTQVPSPGQVSYPEESTSAYVNLNVRGNIVYDTSKVIVDVATRSLYTDNRDYSFKENSNLDIKELYFSQSLDASSFIDIGRINIRSGFAYGFNPTDYFKPEVVRDTADTVARERRNNRLGTVALRYDKSFSEKSISMVFSPELDVEQGSIFTDQETVGLNLNYSNPRNRFLLSYSTSSDTGLQNQFSFFNDDGQLSLGFSSSAVISDQILGYGEWRLSKRRSVIGQYLYDEKSQNTLQPAIADAYTIDDEEYIQQAAIGISLTTTNDITTNIEFHYSEFGMSDDELDTWFDLGEDPALQASLWQLRNQYSRQEELAMQKQIWLRSVWNDITEDFTLGLVASYLPDDESRFVQASIRYDYSDSIVMELQVSQFDGKKRSYFGSLPNEQQAMMQLNWYF